MAIKNITNEINELREAREFDARIEETTTERLVFMLKALIASGHIGRQVMTRALDLADTIAA